MVFEIIIFIIVSFIFVAYVIGTILVNYSIARKGSGVNRNVDLEDEYKKEDDIKTQIKLNIKKSKEEVNIWLNTIKQLKMEIRANDGIVLRGYKYIKDDSINKWAIVLHGYHATPESVLYIAKKFSDEGYNCLVPSMRACAESDGRYIGMGWLDKEDVKCWIKSLIKMNPKCQIVLHGSSMGAATVCMLSGDVLEPNVKAIIEDSGYTSVWDIFKSETKVRFNIPTFPLLNILQIFIKIKAKYDIKEASSINQVKKSRVPILFIHGATDDFVPKYMCENLYEVATCKKEKLIIEGAGHIEAKYVMPEKYYNTIFEFLNNIK